MTLFRVCNDLVDVAIASGDCSAALQLSRQCQTLSQGRDRFSALLQQARIHLRQSDTGEAFRLVKEVQNAQPDNHEALRLLGDIALRRKDFDVASNIYRQFLRSFPDDYPAIADIIPLLARIGHVHHVASYLEEQRARTASNMAFGVRANLFEFFSVEVK